MIYLATRSFFLFLKLVCKLKMHNRRVKLNGYKKGPLEGCWSSLRDTFDLKTHQGHFTVTWCTCFSHKSVFRNTDSHRILFLSNPSFYIGLLRQHTQTLVVRSLKFNIPIFRKNKTKLENRICRQIQDLHASFWCKRVE